MTCVTCQPAGSVKRELEQALGLRREGEAALQRQALIADDEQRIGRRP